jgi:hypothetical protein
MFLKNKKIYGNVIIMGLTYKLFGQKASAVSRFGCKGVSKHGFGGKRTKK